MPGDLDGVGLEPVLSHEVLAREDRRAGAVRGRAALELGQRLVDHLGLHHVFERVLVLELRVRIVHRVLVVLPADLGELLGRGAVRSMCSRPALPNSCGAGGAAANCRSSIISSMCLSIGFVRSMYFAPSEPFSIFSKPAASTQSARPPLDELLGHEQRGRAGRAVVVHVVDRDAGEPELVERALAGGGLAVAVADRRLLDLVVTDAGVRERLAAGLLAPCPGSPSPAPPGFSNLVMPTPTTYTFLVIT